ncbi:MAG: FAD-dependent thymidylate synthase [Planctomycetota bacterium]|jgi:thymidylate synthase (FAD)
MKNLLSLKYADRQPLIDVLDHGFVRLVDCMPGCIPDSEESADYAIAEAARCCYKRGTKSIRDDKMLIRYLMRHNHTSPLEMIEFKFHIKMPIFVARQAIRHRTANVNEMSGRYSEMPEEVYLPRVDNLRTQSTINTQGSEGTIGTEQAQTILDQLGASCQGSFQLYRDCLAKGLVREQARMVIPLTTYTEWYWKIDLHNLLHFLDLRCDEHAQWEIRKYADAILELIKPLVPWTLEAWQDYSPYRDGLMLTGFEVEKLRQIISENDLDLEDIEVDSKIEKLEWREKAKGLGFTDKE